MGGMDARTGKFIGRGPHIVQSIEIMLRTPVGSRVMRREIGFDALQEDGQPKPGLRPEAVEASARRVLATYEPRIDVDQVDVAMNGDALESIAVSYRDRQGGTPGHIVVRYDGAAA